MRIEQQHRGDLLAEVSWLVHVSYFLTLSLREARCAHTDKVLAYLSCSYSLNHYCCCSKLWVFILAWQA